MSNTLDGKTCDLANNFLASSHPPITICNDKLSSGDITRLGFLAAIWGASFIFMRLAVPETGALFAATLRIVLASIFLFGFAKTQGISLNWQRNLKPYALAGLFGAALPFFLFSYAAHFLPAAISALFNATSPLFSAVFSIIWLAEQFTTRKLVGLLIGLTGVLLLVGTGSMLHCQPTLFALAACVAAPACFALSVIVIKHHTCATSAHHIEPLAMATGSMVMAAAMMLPTLPIALPTHVPSLFAIGLLTALAVLPSALAQIIFIPLVARIGATRAMSVSFLIPLFSLLWGFLFLQESIQLSNIAGGIAVLMATGLILKT